MSGLVVDSRDDVPCVDFLCALCTAVYGGNSGD